MGMSASSVLCYGIAFNYRSLDDKDIKLPFPHDADRYEWNDQWDEKYAPAQPAKTPGYKGPEWDDWRRLKEEYDNSIHRVQCEWFGHLDYHQVYYITTSDLHFRNWRQSQALEIDPTKLVVTPEHDAKIKEFCEMFGIQYSQPRWHLLSIYG